MYRNMTGPAHPRAAAEIAVIAEPEDERVWVPQAEGVWFRPLILNTRAGQWCNLLRVRRSGVLSRHLHPKPVHGYVIRAAGTTSSTTGWPRPAPTSSSRPAKSTRCPCPRTARR